ncbi:Mkt1p [Saccharomyces paradoxus]|uniref:Mkt1p n=1 Tax=Saccharomyces paradoxus TaxID=27291 RepID=A0A8B8UYL7_SACPA|nr:Mkt1 [Saccharomyces paradoxus]QHS75823.1 Mkt1 [Saccharomyces paradoxus]
MAIKSLESFLFERGLVGSYAIEALNNCTLGIDVNHYVSRLLTNKREQYLDAIGGFPTSLKMYLESDLKIFKDFNITPIFVFNGGLTYNQLEASGHFTAASASASISSATAGSGGTNATTRSNTESVLLQRNRGWTQWNNLVSSNQNSYIDQPIQPQEPFRHNTPIDSKAYQNDLIAYFIEHGYMYQVAPYSSWFQLAYLLNSAYIDAIYGPTDCLMLDCVDRFILGMEFPNKEFRFIDRSRVMKDLGCTHEEFIDIAMAVGNDLQPTTLPPLQIYPVPQLFDIALEMVLNTGTNFYAYQLSTALQNDSKENIQNYQRGISALRYMPVLKDTGKVELFVQEVVVSEEDSEKNNKDGKKSNLSSPSSASSSASPATPMAKNASEKLAYEKFSTKEVRKPRDIPNDVHDFIGQMLPHEYYFYRSIGLVTGKLFDAIVTGVYPEESPLGGGSATSYRKLVSKSVEIFKNKEINLLTQPINRYYQIKQIKQVKWYAPNEPITLANRMTPSMFETINHLIVKTETSGEKEFSIYEFIAAINASSDMAKDFIYEKVIFPNSVPIESKLNSPFDLLSTNFLRLLVLLEFFTFDFKEKLLKPTKWGEVFLKLNELDIDRMYHESVVIFLVFLKCDVLKLNEEVQPPAPSALSQATLRSYPEESLYVLLITRVLTLFQVDQKPSNYHGPIDKKTLIFRDHLSFIKENLNELFEAVLISSLTSGEFNRLSLDNFGWAKEIVTHLPFKLNSPNTIMAMMWEFFLQKYLHNGNAKNDALSLVATEFNTYKSTPNLDEQFVESHKFLLEVAKVMGKLNDAKLIGENEFKLFTKAIEFATTALSS